MSKSNHRVTDKLEADRLLFNSHIDAWLYTLRMVATSFQYSGSAGIRDRVEASGYFVAY